MYRFMSKHSSDHCVLFCHDPLSHLAINASSCMKLTHARTDFPRFDTKCWNAQVDESLHKNFTISRMCHSITKYPLDTLV